MLSVRKNKAPLFTRCSCCEESIRKYEEHFQVYDGEKAVRGERYCVACESVAYENNECGGDSQDDGESHLRRMEDYAAYQANGCTSAYWEDQY